MHSKKLYLWENFTINTTYLRQLRQFFLFSAEIRFDKFITGHPFLRIDLSLIEFLNFVNYIFHFFHLLF